MSERRKLSPSAVKAPWQLCGLPKETPVLLAFSGGADSRVLLHLLAAQAKRDGFRLSVAHVNHGLREAAAQDAAFCRSLAASYGCEFDLLVADVKRLADESGRSLEWEAREVRYGFFSDLMKKKQIPILVTAHHADDNLETVLFRLSRGTGLQGLCGILPVRGLSEGYLVRPLLPFSRREIHELCIREGLDFVQDQTNFEPICARNRIRLETVPSLEAVAGDPQESVFRMTQSLLQDLDFLESSARDFLQQQNSERGLTIDALQNLHVAVRSRVWQMLVPASLETVHMDALEALLQGEGHSGSRVSLPNRWVACRQGKYLSVLPDLRCEGTAVELPFGTGRFDFCDGKLIVCVTKAENFAELPNVHNLSTHKSIIIERVGLRAINGAVLRSRKEGDAITVGGRRKRLADLYREASVPPMLRDAIPVLVNKGELLWAPFVGACDAVADEQAGDCYQIEVLLLSKGLERDGVCTTSKRT